MTGFEQNLAGVVSCSVNVVDSDIYPSDEIGEGSVAISFSNGTRLRADYWRLLHKRSRRSSFDHRQKYGLPAPIDAIAELRTALENSELVAATLDKESADLIFLFDNDYKLQILTVTGHEIWEIHFPDGAGAYSNYL
ncbi:MAG TPA: hypothetical protein VJR47_17635 [Stellaceae bacterium]|nr:hypothetical protein [Stellaceae bacterium]